MTRNEVAKADLTARIVNGLGEAGVLISSTGMPRNVMKIMPSWVFSKANVD
jgi:4-aminobutyrate aminotransferase-like enzyme